MMPTFGITKTTPDEEVCLKQRKLNGSKNYHERALELSCSIYDFYIVLLTYIQSGIDILLRSVNHTMSITVHDLKSHN